MSILELIHSFYAVLTMLTLATLKLWWVIEEKFLEILYMGPSFFFFLIMRPEKGRGNITTRAHVKIFLINGITNSRRPST